MTRKFDLIRHEENGDVLFIAMECPPEEQEDGWTASPDDFFEFGSLEEARLWAEVSGVRLKNI